MTTVTIPRDVAEAALALVERVLADQGDAADVSIITLQHDLADSLRAAGVDFPEPNKITS